MAEMYVMRESPIIVSLFANARDYSNRTCIFVRYTSTYMYTCICKSCWSTESEACVVAKNDTITTFLSIAAIKSTLEYMYKSTEYIRAQEYFILAAIQQDM